MVVLYHIQMKFSRPPDFSKRGWKEVMREANRRTILHWHKEMLPRHFKADAAGRYGYRPRRVWYVRQKHYKPALIFSGRAARAVQGTPLVKAFPTRARLTMNAPAYYKIRRRDKRPPLIEETLRITFDESQELGQYMKKQVAQLMAEKRGAYYVNLFGG